MLDERWQWVTRYLAVTACSVFLAWTLSKLRLFAAADVIDARVNAALLVQFLGYGTALLVFLLLAYRLAAELRELREETGPWVAFASIVRPLATMIVTAVGYDVGLLILKPLLAPGERSCYDWIFIAGLLASAAWLLRNLYVDDWLSVLAAADETSGLTAPSTRTAAVVAKRGPERPLVADKSMPNTSAISSSTLDLSVISATTKAKPEPSRPR